MDLFETSIAFVFFEDQDCLLYAGTNEGKKINIFLRASLSNSKSGLNFFSTPIAGEYLL